MSIDLEVLSTRAALITPAELDAAWRAVSSDPSPEIRGLDDGMLAPCEVPLVMGSQYALHFAAGHAIGFGVSENRASHVDERSYLAEFGDTADIEDIADAWARTGHTYDLLLSGTYQRQHVGDMTLAAAVVARIVDGRVIALEPLPMGLKRGVYRPGDTGLASPAPLISAFAGT